MDANALATCTKWGRTSKQDNGCKAYANGWKKGKNRCHGCGAVSRNYPACSVDECNLLCEDLYRNKLHIKACKSGCEKYSALTPGLSNQI